MTTLVILTIIVSILNIFENFYKFGISNGSSTAGKILSIFLRDINPFQIAIIIKNNKIIRSKPKFPNRVIFMMNHISRTDGFCLYSVLPNNTKFISSGPMWTVPIIDYVSNYAQHIQAKFDGNKCINRKEILKKSKKTLDNNNPIAVFPEGGINRFKLKKGMFIFSKKHNVNIIPIRIKGTDNLKNNIVQYDVGDLIKTEDYDINSLMDKVSKYIFK